MHENGKVLRVVGRLHPLDVTECSCGIAISVGQTNFVQTCSVENSRIFAIAMILHAGLQAAGIFITGVGQAFIQLCLHFTVVFLLSGCGLLHSLQLEKLLELAAKR